MTGLRPTPDIQADIEQWMRSEELDERREIVTRLAGDVAPLLAQVEALEAARNARLSMDLAPVERDFHAAMEGPVSPARRAAAHIPLLVGEINRLAAQVAALTEQHARLRTGWDDAVRQSHAATERAVRAEAEVARYKAAIEAAPQRMLNTIDPARDGFTVRAECVEFVRSLVVPVDDQQDEPVGRPCKIAPTVGGVVKFRDAVLCTHEGGFWHAVSGDTTQPDEQAAAIYRCIDAGHDVGQRHDDGYLGSATCHDCDYRFARADLNETPTQPDEQRCEHGMLWPHDVKTYWQGGDRFRRRRIRCPGPSSGVGQK